MIEVVSIEEVHLHFFFRIDYFYYLIGRGGVGNTGASSRFFSHGHNRGYSHDHSSIHRTSHSPDRRSFSYRNEYNTDKYSSTTNRFSASPSRDRSLPIEALRKNDQANFDSLSNNSNNYSNKSSLTIDETMNRSGPTN